MISGPPLPRDHTRRRSQVSRRRQKSTVCQKSTADLRVLNVMSTDGHWMHRRSAVDVRQAVLFAGVYESHPAHVACSPLIKAAERRRREEKFLLSPTWQTLTPPARSPSRSLPTYPARSSSALGPQPPDCFRTTPRRASAHRWRTTYRVTIQN